MQLNNLGTDVSFSKEEDIEPYLRAHPEVVFISWNGKLYGLGKNTNQLVWKMNRS